MKSTFITLISLLVANAILGQNRFGLGVTGSPDMNFYKYSAEKFRDDERSNKISIGYSAGIVLNYRLNDRVDLYSNVVYASKYYSPDRLFHFGILRNVKMKTLDIPLNLKYNLIELKNTADRIYLLGGLTYQIELVKKADYDFFNGYDNSYDFISEQNYLIPNIGAGVEKNWNENNLIRIQLNYRLLKCHCEYLNPLIDKFGIEIALIKTWANKK